MQSYDNSDVPHMSQSRPEKCKGVKLLRFLIIVDASPVAYDYMETRFYGTTIDLSDSSNLVDK